MSEKIKLTGSVYHIGPVQQVSEKFRKREFVIKTNEQFEQYVLIQVINDRCELIDALKFNDLIEVMINIKGREWIDKNGVKKFFNTLEAWQVTFANINAQNQNNFATPQNNEYQIKRPDAIEQPKQNFDPLGIFNNKENENDPF